jgi:hypothetical protein
LHGVLFQRPHPCLEDSNYPYGLMRDPLKIGATILVLTLSIENTTGKNARQA